MATSDICANVVSQYIQRLQADFEATKSDGGCFLLTPFRKPDGEGIELELESLPNGSIRISDMGDTISYLFVNGLTIGKPVMDRIKYISALHGVSLEHSIMKVEIRPEAAGDALHELIQAVLATTDLIQTRRSTTPRRIRLDTQVESLIKFSGATYETDYEVPGEHEQHKFRFHLNSGRNLLLQPLTAPNASDAHSLAERWAYRFMDVIRSDDRWRPIAVLDDRGSQVNADIMRESNTQLIWTPRAIAPIQEHAIPWSDRRKLSELLTQDAIGPRARSARV